MGTVLMVDDDPAILRTYSRILLRAGHEVHTAADGDEAIACLGSAAFDVVVSDVAMPHLSGIEFLRAVRARDADLPVIIMTGGPTMEAAVEAVEYGASRFLVKPVPAQLFREAVDRQIRLHDLARLARQALALSGANGKWQGDRETLEARFDHALESIWMEWQPIVSVGRRRVFAYEALMRNAEPTLARPDHLLEAAEHLRRIWDLGRAVRALVVRAAVEVPEPIKLFVNLHAADLGDDELFATAAPFSAIADRVVLEVTERTSLDGVRDSVARIASLREIGFQIAVDDLGSGYSGLASFAHLDPEVVKLDMSLVRGIDQNPTKQRVVRSMVSLCEELGMHVITEGVETAAESETLLTLGCDLLQGYLYGRPQKGFRIPTL